MSGRVRAGGGEARGHRSPALAWRAEARWRPWRLPQLPRASLSLHGPGAAELGFWLARRHWGRGIASEAVGAAIDSAWARLPHLHRIYARCYAHNAGTGRPPPPRRVHRRSASPAASSGCTAARLLWSAYGPAKAAALPACLPPSLPCPAGSQAVLRKLGFQQEGRLRQAAFKDGQLVDELAFGLLRPEWEQRRRQQQQQEGSQHGAAG